jgi:hypothetical protein
MSIALPHTYCVSAQRASYFDYNHCNPLAINALRHFAPLIDRALSVAVGKVG